MNGTVHTVLGPVPTDRLGVTAVHEALLSVVPGAEHAFDITIDRAEIFDELAAKLRDFREHGGGTIVDSTGMFHGRDLSLYEALSRATGVHIIASTGMGPEEMLGGYFLTPQTNPPTPWPAERFAELFAAEVAEGMVVPRLERRGAAGLITVATTREGTTATDESLLRGAARAALATGVAVSIRFGRDAVHDLEIVLDEGVAAERVIVGGLDRRHAIAAGAHLEIARRGAFAGIDHVGMDDEVTDADRADLVVALVDAGHADRILLSSSATGVAKGHEGRDLLFSGVLAAFVPLLAERGLDEAVIRSILTDNPRTLLAVRNDQ